MKLEITNKIIENQTYAALAADIERLESDRIFCRHGIEHLLSVARIALIMCRERKLEISPDLIYSTALLHDIGRAAQYKNGSDRTDHAEEGAKAAREILREVGADGDFAETVCRCILAHRTSGEQRTEFERIFCAADKMSRSCFCCQAREECNWRQEKMNLKIKI